MLLAAADSAGTHLAELFTGQQKPTLTQRGTGLAADGLGLTPQQQETAHKLVFWTNTILAVGNLGKILTANPPTAEVPKVAGGAGAASGPGYRTWNQFQAGTAGQFSSRAEAAAAWSAYKQANGIVTGTVRSQAARSQYLRSLADHPNTPSWMRKWLSEGRVSPGYEVDHITPLSIGGADTPANMRLQAIDLHRLWHYHYHPWRKPQCQKRRNCSYPSILRSPVGIQVSS